MSPPRLHDVAEREAWVYAPGAYINIVGDDISLIGDDAPVEVTRKGIPVTLYGREHELRQSTPNVPDGDQWRWMEWAKCRTVPITKVDFTDSKRTKRARWYCSRCPVVHECLEACPCPGQAHMDVGIWGGTTPFDRELDRLRRERAAS